MLKEKRCPWGHIIHWLGIGAGVVAGLFLSDELSNQVQLFAKVDFGGAFPA